jgi:hypothetical protein
VKKKVHKCHKKIDKKDLVKGEKKSNGIDMKAKVW